MKFSLTRKPPLRCLCTQQGLLLVGLWFPIVHAIWQEQIVSHIKHVDTRCISPRDDTTWPAHTFTLTLDFHPHDNASVDDYHGNMSTYTAPLFKYTLISHHQYASSTGTSISSWLLYPWVTIPPARRTVQIHGKVYCRYTFLAGSAENDQSAIFALVGAELNKLIWKMWPCQPTCKQHMLKCSHKLGFTNLPTSLMQ